MITEKTTNVLIESAWFDPATVRSIAKHHGVKPENILLTAGSGEVLDVVGTAFLPAGKKVLVVEPSYSSVYQHASSIKSEAIKLPLGIFMFRNRLGGRQ